MTRPAEEWTIPLSGDCPVADSLRLIGGKHKPRILHCLLNQDLHFLELNRAIEPISKKVLTEQLRDRQEADLIVRTARHDARQRISYGLTSRGRALADILGQIYHWSQEHPTAKNKNTGTEAPV